MVGVLSRTVVRGCAIKYLLGAQLAGDATQHLISVSDHSVQIQQLDPQNNLLHVITKTDFGGAKIRSAGVFGPNKHEQTHPFIKLENELRPSDSQDYTQSVVLTLDSNELLFLAIRYNRDGDPYFITHSVPIPAFSKVLFQPGEHLAVDHRSRALAVAALEREVLLYAVADSKDRSGLQWPPQFAQRVVAVDGVIAHMEFLRPSDDDSSHIILLLIVIVDRKVRAVWLDWYEGGDIHQAQLHPGQSLETTSSVPPLLVPLRNASFALIGGKEAKRWRYLTTGSASSQAFQIVASTAEQAGSSGKYPQWTSWTLPRRSSTALRDTDTIYLAREDGVVSVVQIKEDNILSCMAIDTGCAIGSGFVSLGSGWDDDVLAVVGDMSTGRLISIPQIDIHAAHRDGDVEEVHAANLIQTIPNWASVTDCIFSEAAQAHGRVSRDPNSILVTSGRQPYGTITELRKGFEAQLLLYIDLEVLASMTEAWVVTRFSESSYMIVLSGPSSTKVFELSIDGESIAELGPSDSPSVELALETLLVSSISDRLIVQVTQNFVRISDLSYEHPRINSWPVCENGAILVSVIDPDCSTILLGIRKDGDFALLPWLVAQPERPFPVCIGDDQANASSLKMASEPIAMSVVSRETSSIVAVSTADGRVHLLDFVSSTGITIVSTIELPMGADSHTICDSIATLQPDGNSFSLLVCGLRDGRVATYKLATMHLRRLHEEVPCLITIGKTSVKLSRLSAQSLCAMSGPTLCRLSWDKTSEGLSVDNIWIADKLRPELTQSTIAACVPITSDKHSSNEPLAGGLMFLTGDQLMFAKLRAQVSTVPRQISVSGTPSRMIYMEQQRCFVCASTRYLARSLSITSGRTELRRQIYPVLDFIPAKSTTPSFTYQMQPGSKVYALLEWFISFGSEKVYSYLLVGGSYTRRNGSERGRVMMLQPTNRRWKVVDVNEGHITKFEEPVLALALFDKMTYIACSGHFVHVQRFQPDSKRWLAVCPPYRLTSHCTQVTVSDHRIYISTAADSLVTLYLREGDHNAAELLPAQFAPKADLSLNHLIIKLDDQQIALLSNKHGQLNGLTTPPPSSHPGSRQIPPSPARLLFEANLPSSITRLRHANTRPSWKPTPSPSVLHDRIVGSCADGTILGIAILDRNLWRRLFWLQRLCEWHETKSRKSTTNQRPAYQSSLTGGTDFDDDGDEMINDADHSHDNNHDLSFNNLRSYTPGLHATPPSSTIVLHTSCPEAQDMHIDGDVLARLFDGPGNPEDMIVEILRTMAARGEGQRSNRACAWVKENLEEEVACVKGLVVELKAILDAWF